jgi:hypothetical protein
VKNVFSFKCDVGQVLTVCSLTSLLQNLPVILISITLLEFSISAKSQLMVPGTHPTSRIFASGFRCGNKKAAQ